MPEKALIPVDKETCFVSINIVYPKDLDKETLEAFAQIFDFLFTPQVISDDAWAELQTDSS